MGRIDPYRLDQARRVLTTPLLVALAILGYVLGHGGHHASVSPAAEVANRTLLTSSVLLSYPADWAPARSAPTIPGLALSGPARIAPHGDGAGAGLLTGQMLGGEASPLPGSLLARLRGLPAAGVVNLAETQAYRYSKLSVAGFDRALTLYAIPGPAGNPTAIACYASTAAASEMRTCEGIVASLQLQFAPQSYILTPDPEYARMLSRSVEAVEARRLALRGSPRGRGSQPMSPRVAAQLARTMSGAAASLSTMQAPPAVSQAQALLSRSLGQAGDAYDALAAAAGGRSRSAYAAARSRVYAAESAVTTALRGFALFGYR